MKGFTFPYKGKTVFIKTERERKTRSLARNILNAMLLPDAPSAIDGVLYWLTKAECELRQLDNGKWYSIKGKDFTEFGPVEDLEIIHIV